MTRARERSVTNDLAQRNTEIRSWISDYGKTVEELRSQLKRGAVACGGYWAERFPAVELPKALSDMDRAVEVLRWLTRTGEGADAGESDRFRTASGNRGV